MKTGQRTASSSGEARATGDEREAQGTTGRKRNESLPLSRSLPPLRAHFFFQQRDVCVRGRSENLYAYFASKRNETFEVFPYKRHFNISATSDICNLSHLTCM